MSLFSGDEERRVSDAITQAERKTSGEVVVVVATDANLLLRALEKRPLVGPVEDDHANGLHAARDGLTIALDQLGKRGIRHECTSWYSQSYRPLSGPDAPDDREDNSTQFSPPFCGIDAAFRGLRQHRHVRRGVGHCATLEP